jgi:hypothetical protein
MNTEDKSKVLEKIKKCLALSKSPNEHEAAAALRQAQKLMAMHNLSEDDLEGVDYVCADVLTDYEYGKRKPIVIVVVANLLQNAMGVEVVMSIGRRDNFRGPVHMVVYCGARHKVHLAVFAHTVVWRAVGAAWRKYSAENPHVKKQQGARAGFYAGWCESVRSKIEKLVPDEAEKAKIQKAIARRFGQTGSAKVSQGASSRTFHAGADAGKDFDLNRPISQDRRRIGVDK